MEEATMTWPMLVSAEQVAARLADPRLRIFDCRFELARPAAGREAWLRSHLPGAVHVDLHHDLAGPTTPRSGRHPLPAATVFAARLRDWGVDDDSLLLAYDECSGVWAARFWWMTATWLGHRHVALLDGGLRAWSGLGLPTTADVPATPATGNFTARVDASRIADADATAAAALDPEGSVLDARAGERFRGEVEPIDPVAGHVPGALNLPASTVTGPDGHFLAPAALTQVFGARLGRVPPAATIAMCGSGVTACQLLFAMEYAGLPGARLYPGSWSEWSRDPSRPVAKEGARG
jgi:thiosulfate/3-mercaptopyruvate sulfurtransferase